MSASNEIIAWNRAIFYFINPSSNCPAHFHFLFGAGLQTRALNPKIPPRHRRVQLRDQKILADNFQNVADNI